MEDGRYHLTLITGDYTGIGELTLANNQGQGHDGVWKVEVNLWGEGQDLNAVANVLMSPRIVEEATMPHHYSLSMAGMGAADSFSISGTGPNGVPVTINGERSGPAIG